MQPCIDTGVETFSLSESERHELHRVIRMKLTDLPELCIDDGCGTHEPAEARTIGAEDDGHVTGEVDRADGVRVVVNVRRVQARLTTIATRPLRASDR